MWDLALMTAIGWLAKKLCEVAWDFAKTAFYRIPAACPYTLVKKDELKDLSEKARCLQVLTEAYDQLPKDTPSRASETSEAKTWHH